MAAAAALAFGGAGWVYGTFAAGGSDSSCYVLMADAFAAGQLQPRSDLASIVPWPDALLSLTPGGFVPSATTASGFAPICAPGFSVILAPFLKIGGEAAMFAVTPLFGILLVMASFVAAQTLGGSLAGAIAAVLVASSPAALYQVVQPMNDIATAALWVCAFAALLRRKWAIAGGCVGLALLVRPNLLPMALVAGVFVLAVERLKLRPAVVFAIAALPFALVVLWLNAQLYGGPFTTGYGDPGRLFALASVPANAPRYLQWLVSTHTAFPLLCLAAPLVLGPAQRRAGSLGLLLAAANVSIYLVYMPFDDWSYLRFLLPAIALMIVLASAAFVSALGRFTSRAPLLAAIVAAMVSAFNLRVADDRQAFRLWHLEQRYRSAGAAIRSRLPENAVIFAVWDSGAVRFHGRTEAVSWDRLDPAWLDRSLEWARARRLRPFILVESWEEPAFRERFAAASDVGKLDWPPRLEVDRVVRIFDPDDRATYHAGEQVPTDYVWPLRQ